MLRVRNLTISFSRYASGLKRRELTVITDLDLSVSKGEVVGVVGSSGAGKSLLAHAILGILPKNASLSGEMAFKNEPLDDKRKKLLRGKEIGLIPQSVGFLNPLARVGRQVARSARLSGLDARTASARTRDAFDRYELGSEVMRRFPFQVSGGMARRVLTATATAGQAELIIADEPTTGLHPEAVGESLGHLRQLADSGRGVILITHDISACLKAADKVVVFYAGTTVEQALASDFTPDCSRLRHPYTIDLWKSMPENGFSASLGTQPTPDSLPRGCLYGPRCARADETCRAKRPELVCKNNGKVRCFHA